MASPTRTGARHARLASQVSCRRDPGRAGLPRPRRLDRQGDPADRRGRRQRRQADRLSRDLPARLPLVHLARFAGLGHAVHPALSRQLARLRQRPGRSPGAGGEGPRHHRRHGPQREAGRQPLHGPVDHRRRRRDDRPAEEAQAHARRAHRVRRRRRQRPRGARHAARPRRRAVLLGASAAALEVRDVRAERAGAHRRLAELLALSRRRLRARAGGEQRGEPDLRGRGQLLRARALRHRLEGDGRDAVRRRSDEDSNCCSRAAASRRSTRPTAS